MKETKQIWMKVCEREVTGRADGDADIRVGYVNKTAAETQGRSFAALIKLRTEKGIFCNFQIAWKVRRVIHASGEVGRVIRTQRNIKKVFHTTRVSCQS